jgi:hypothetical protein
MGTFRLCLIVFHKFSLSLLYEERSKRYGRVGLSVGSGHAILKEDFGIRRVCAKFVPRLLSDDQMECRKTISGDMFEQ